VNGVVVKRSGPTGKGGWSFEGNALTTIIPVASQSISAKVIIEIHRATGLTARRSELDGFAGAMTRLRGTYDALIQTWPVAAPPDVLIDAMQSGDRLGYHPELAQQELAHFHQILPQAQSAVEMLGQDAKQRLEEFANRMKRDESHPTDMDAQKQRRLDALARAQKIITEAGK